MLDRSPAARLSWPRSRLTIAVNPGTCGGCDEIASHRGNPGPFERGHSFGGDSDDRKHRTEQWRGYRWNGRDVAREKPHRLLTSLSPTHLQRQAGRQDRREKNTKSLNPPGRATPHK